jgi:hypothetical protein
LAAARELARLARHLAALPLDFAHRSCVARFAAVWHARAGLAKRAAAYAAAAAAAAAAEVVSASGAAAKAKAKAKAASLARCAFGFEGTGFFFPYGKDDDARSLRARSIAEDAYESRVSSSGETPGWVCAATARSLRFGTFGRTDSDGDDDAAECERCRATHCASFAKSAGALCAVCDAPFASGL